MNSSFLSMARLRFLGLGVLLLAFQLAASPERSTFDSFARIVWDPNCKVVATPPELNVLGSALSISEGQTATCQSQPITIPTSELELELSSASGASDPSLLPRLKLHAVDKDSLVVALRLQTVASSWSKARAFVPNSIVGVPVRLEVEPNSEAPSALQIRDRVNFYRPPNGARSAFDRLLEQPVSKVAISILLGVALLGWLRRDDLGSYSEVRLFCFFLLVSLAVHFRATAFFQWDEWHVLERYSQLGVKGVIYRHNEHFLPLFFALYYLQAKVFGDAYRFYLLLSVVLHAVNALLLSRVVFELLSPSDRQQMLARSLALFFLISGLHAEPLHWAFEQCLLVANALLLGACLSSLRYLRERRVLDLAVASICAFTAPLFFGNGFSLPPQVVLFCVAAVIVQQIQVRLRGVALVAGLGLACGASGALYRLNQQGAGHGLAEASLFGNLPALGDYLAAGSQVGAVLRSLSLFPSLELGAAPHVAAVISSRLGIVLPNSLSALGFFTLVGYLASAALLLGPLWKTRSYRTVLLWGIGQAIIICALLLPALGRWQFGPNQSLALRYHYNTMFGVLILLIPVVELWAVPKLNKALCNLGVFLLGACVACQLWLGLTFVHYAPVGAHNRDFVEQLTQWQAVCKRRGIGTYEAHGTELVGLQPTYPPTVTPGRHPSEIYSVLHWLAPTAYPR